MKLKSIVFFIFIFSSYVKAQDNKFIVSVHGIPEEGMAVFSYRNADYERTTDTVKATDGHGQFIGRLLEPNLANIQFLDGTGRQLKYQNFFLSTGKTAITFNAVDRSTAIRGGPEQVIYNELKSTVLAAKDTFAGGRMVSLLSELRAKRREGIPDSLFQDESQEHQRLLRQWEHEDERMHKQFIVDHPHSLVSVSAIQYLIGYVGDDEITRLYNGLGDEAKQSRAGMMVNGYIIAKRSTQEGMLALNFSQADPDGKMVSLADYRGKYVLLDFWASWCIPCREENPNLVAAYDQFHEKGFDILGISLDNQMEKWLEAIAADNLNWRQVSDLQGWKNEVSVQYGIYAIPQNILVDPSGIIVAKSLRGKELINKLEELLVN